MEKSKQRNNNEITERKKVEEEIRRSKTYAELVLKVTPSATFTVDTNRCIMSWNRRAEEIIGYTAEEMVGKGCVIFARKPCEDKCGLYSDDIQKPIIGKECEIRKKDGQMCIISKNADLLKNEKGNVIGGIESFEDITERKKAEEELSRAYKELKESQLQLIQVEKLAALGELAAGVAHEIENPLFVISGEAEMLLKDEDKDKNIRDVSRVIVEQSERIKGIINRLLEFSRKREFKQEPLDINDAVGKSISLLGYQAKMENVEIIKELEPDLPKVFGDDNQIQEAFLDIMINAVQAMEGGGKLTTRTHREKATTHRDTLKFKLGTELVVIEFKDTGKGMDEETLKKIFDPFFSTKERGVGLGLSICYKIIENHKGIIEAYSKLGEGCTFIVKLPIPKEGGRE